ncbi:MAG: hypothetical protein AAF739_03120 [Pseudomonadota bacterium]
MRDDLTIDGPVRPSVYSPVEHLVLSAGDNVKAAAAAAIAQHAVLWQDFTRVMGMRSAIDGSGAQPGSGDPVGWIEDRIMATNAVAPSAGTRPSLSASGGLQFNGVDQALNLPFVGGAGPSSADIFAVVQTDDDPYIVLDILTESSPPNRFIFCSQDGNAANPRGNIGAATVHIDNGPAIASRDALHDARPASTFLLEARGADLSSFDGFLIGHAHISGFEYAGRIDHIIVGNLAASGYDRDALRAAIGVLMS